MSLTGPTLSVALTGDRTAYYPVAYRVLPDGRWEKLVPAGGMPDRAELRPGETVDLEWPATQFERNPGPLDPLLPVMMRFAEMQGGNTGQIYFFYPAPEENPSLDASYDGGRLAVSFDPTRHRRISATWVLWSAEYDLFSLLHPARSGPAQPPVHKIDWRSGARTVWLDTGKAQPEVILLHKTDEGFLRQTVVRGQPPAYIRTTWANAGELLYLLALVALTISAFAVMANLLRPSWPRTPQ